jgi:hypothetical protein
MRAATFTSYLGILLAPFVSFAEVDATKLPPAAAKQIEFLTDIKPILDQNCIKCHGAERPRSRFRLDNRESALKGGDGGIAIIPGDSTNSSMIHYVARLVPDMEMPPPDEGTPLTAEQVGLLRAWIDQGVQWSFESTEPEITFTLAPAIGFVSVTGNERQFREHWWMRDGLQGGLESFEGFQQLSPDARVTLKGHALTDDYAAELVGEKVDLGFFRFGFQHFRSYDTDAGGYYPPFNLPAFDLDRNLHLDTGRAYVDFGLTLPNWPRLTLGYELQYRQGEKATLQWGTVTEGGNSKNIHPALKNIDERVHILKFDLEYERGGWRFEDSFRGEWTDLNTRQQNVFTTTPGIADSLVTDTARQGWKSFQGANTVRVERRFKDWFYTSAGYLYSHLDADADFNFDRINPSGLPVASPFIQRSLWTSQRIVLERESHVGNANVFLGPWKNFSLALGAQSEWTRQNGTLSGVETDFIAPPFNGPPFNIPDQVRSVSAITDIDRMAVDETAQLRFSGLRFTTLFAEVRLQQESIGHYENVEGNDPFIRDTDANSESMDFRGGFESSPLVWLKFGSRYRFYNKSTTYNDGFLDGEPLDILGYPTFINSRDVETQEIESQITLRPAKWLKATFTHKLVASDYRTTTEPISLLTPGDFAPGGEVFSGNYDAQVFSANVTLTPWRRLHWFASASYQDVRSVSFHENSEAVVPYSGDIWSLSTRGRFVLTKKTDLTLGWTFSTADFRQDNLAAGLPVGVEYDLHGFQVGLVSRHTKNVTTKIQYGYYQYDEPSSGSANDYRAHAVFASVSWRLH